ncbi:uncharacterized protein LOC5518808 [Nematostella vectensis]|uniref:uncharacterized protein LOC5518808 n=1 Tax=Nematostella vectensis TaxID=45351 RepID=UPI0020775865|nr:uncharacterized protein LOC5518808 [Nematostella vectensis]
MAKFALEGATSVLLACGILLLSHAQGDQCTGNNLSISMKSRLECGIFQTVLTNRTGCIRTCLTTLKCFSLNFYQSLTNGSEICELVDDVRKNKLHGCMKKHQGDHTEIEDFKPCHPSRKCETRTRKALEENWYQLGSKKFKAFSEKKTWHEANEACGNIGASLATVANEFESQLIGEVLLPLIKENPVIDVKKTFSPIGYWKLDGSDNTTSGLSLAGKVAYVKDEETKTTVLHFPGISSDYATTPRYDLSADFTIAMWVKVFKIESMFLYSYWASSLSLFRFVLTPDGKIEFQSNGLIITTSRKIIPEKWYFIAVNWKSQNRDSRIYLDGLKAAHVSGVFNGEMAPSTGLTNYYIGLKLDSNGPIHARIAHLMVFDQRYYGPDLIEIRDATIFGKEAWLGLNYRNTEQEFIWPNSEPATYKNFAPGYPDTPGSNCVVARDWDIGKWADTKCSFKRPYICTKPA